MAKKSAKSKGFRKQSAKKPYLSKRDIVLLCLLLVAVAIGAFFLFRYDDGALKVKDGEVVTEGDNWLIVNGSNTRGGRRYFKLGEVNAPEGCDLEKTPVLTDANLSEYVITPQAEGEVYDRVTLSSSHASAEALSNYAASTLAGLEGTEVGEVQSGEIHATAARYFFYTSAPVEGDASTGEAEATVEEAVEEEPADDGAAEAVEEATDEAAEAVEEAADGVAEAVEEAADGAAEAVEEAADGAQAMPYRKSLCAYFDASHDSCAVFRMERGAETAEGLPTDEAMLNAMEGAVAALVLEAPGK